MSSVSCSNCGSTQIAGPYRIHGGNGHIKIDLPGLRTATLVSLTCTNCGYVEFYVDDGGLRNIRRLIQYVPEEEKEEPEIDDEEEIEPESETETIYYCTQCNHEVNPEDRFCPNCGQKLVE